MAGTSDHDDRNRQSGGTHIDVVLRAPELIKQMGGGEIPTTRAEKAIQTVRKMLREKKSTPA
jgi:hypothetical protein